MLLEFADNVLVGISCLRGFVVLAMSEGAYAAIMRGKLVIADGIISALGYKTAATLLTTIELQTWTAIGMFAAILTLRTLVKQALLPEQRLLRQPHG